MNFIVIAKWTKHHKNKRVFYYEIASLHEKLIVTGYSNLLKKLTELNK